MRSLSSVDLNQISGEDHLTYGGSIKLIDSQRKNVHLQVIFVSNWRIFATWRLIFERIHCKH